MIKHAILGKTSITFNRRLTDFLWFDNDGILTWKRQEKRRKILKNRHCFLIVSDSSANHRFTRNKLIHYSRRYLQSATLWSMDSTTRRVLSLWPGSGIAVYGKSTRKRIHRSKKRQHEVCVIVEAQESKERNDMRGFYGTVYGAWRWTGWPERKFTDR